MVHPSGSGDCRFKGFLDTLRCISLAHVREGCPCMRIDHMQTYFELLCVLSEFRKGAVWRENPPGNVVFASTGLWM